MTTGTEGLAPRPSPLAPRPSPLAPRSLVSGPSLDSSLTQSPSESSFRSSFRSSFELSSVHGLSHRPSHGPSHYPSHRFESCTRYKSPCRPHLFITSSSFCGRPNTKLRPYICRTPHPTPTPTPRRSHHIATVHVPAPRHGSQAGSGAARLCGAGEGRAGAACWAVFTGHWLPVRRHWLIGIRINLFAGRAGPCGDYQAGRGEVYWGLGFSRGEPRRSWLEGKICTSSREKYALHQESGFLIAWRPWDRVRRGGTWRGTGEGGRGACASAGGVPSA